MLQSNWRVIMELVETGENATALHIVDNSISVGLGSIAIGLPCPPSALARSRPAKTSSHRERTDRSRKPPTLGRVDLALPR